eukprot:COSAG01_NODE_8388_length_2803_cov_10.424030_4_plen_91_part_00
MVQPALTNAYHRQRQQQPLFGLQTFNSDEGLCGCKKTKTLVVDPDSERMTMTTSGSCLSQETKTTGWVQRVTSVTCLGKSGPNGVERPTG